MAKIILGVCGSVAAYRACDLARDFKRLGHDVRVCLTESATQFVSPLLFESLTGEPSLSSVFDEPVRARMAHIDYARWADLIVVCPATANTMARIAHGEASDMLTAICLVTDAPLLIAPAMNPSMYSHPATQEAMRVLESRGVTILEPLSGEVACGENGQGKLAANHEIVSAVQSTLARRTSLAGKSVLITNGPTREAIDDVRFISNRSSGKMGRAIAKAALAAGANVTVVSGPVSVCYPANCRVIQVQSALEMLAACEAVEGPDLVIGVAAVADYRPASKHEGKLRRSSEAVSIELIPNPDIVATLAKRFPSATVVGFAAEPTSDLTVATEKLNRKGISGIAANDISNQAIGFESDTNQIQLVWKDGTTLDSGLLSKDQVAVWLLDQIIKLASLKSQD